jgi:hypothetical protein
MDQETEVQNEPQAESQVEPQAALQSRPAATLSVLAATLALVCWMRHDALDTYWQQTRHSELGLSSMNNDPAWAGGVLASQSLAAGLDAQQQWFDLVGSRMTLATNIVLLGPEVMEPPRSTLVPSKSLASLAPVRVENGALAPVQKAPPAVPAHVDDKTAIATTTIPAAVAQGGVKPEAIDADAAAKPALPPLNEDGRIVLTPQDKVLLVGDSMMQGVAPHVARALQKANISSVDLSKQSTGLAYPSYFDWPATVQKAIPDAKITVMVVFLGANDTWDIFIGGRAERFGSEKWQSVYASRIDSMVKFAESQNVRVIWLGAPNMGREKINSGVKILNQLYAAEANDGLARFVSTREILGGGNTDVYQKHITTENGKTVTVRTDDGVHFTRIGQELLSNLILRQFVIPSLPSLTAAPSSKQAS